MNQDDLPKSAPDNSQPQPPSPDVVQTDPPSATTPASPIAAETLKFTELFDQIAEKIIEQQEAVIGPIAVDQARKVSELTINWANHKVDISGNPQNAIDALVEQYKELFGQIAVQACKDAAIRYISQLPLEQQPQ